MYEWSDLQYFLAVHRGGSLAEAGRTLKVDPTTVGRRVAALEDRLGAKLFVRSSRGWKATPVGLRVLPAAERAEDASIDVQRLASGATRELAGRVRVSTIEVVASRIIAPVLERFRERHPRIRLDLWCSTEMADLAHGVVDIAVRVGRPTEPGLVARKIASAVSRPYASQAYLERTGLSPKTDRLVDCEVLVLPLPHRWLDEAGRVRVVLRSNEISVITSACVAGVGIALLPDLLAADHPELVPLDGLQQTHTDPVWLVTHPDLLDVARVRAVVDFLVEVFSPGDAASQASSKAP